MPFYDGSISTSKKDIDDIDPDTRNELLEEFNDFCDLVEEHLEDNDSQDKDNTELDELKKRLLETEAHNRNLLAQIDLVAKWFMSRAPELIEEGSACENAVRMLEFYTNDDVITSDHMREAQRLAIKGIVDETLHGRKLFETSEDVFVNLLTDAVEKCRTSKRKNGD